MKKLLLLALLMTAMSCAAKKVKVQVHVVDAQHKDSVYFTVNEDNDHVIALPLQKGQLTATLEIEKDAFVRVCDERSERIYVSTIFIADGKPVDINLWEANVSGSSLNNRFFAYIKNLNHISNSGILIDPPMLPSDISEADRRATMEHYRARMEADHRRVQAERQAAIDDIFAKESGSIIPAWFYYEHSDVRKRFDKNDKKAAKTWGKHPILKRLDRDN